MDFFAMATILLFKVNNIMNSLTADSLLALGKSIYYSASRLTWTIANRAPFCLNW